MLDKFGCVCIVLFFCSGSTYADQLAFGTFRSQANAQNWAQKLSQVFAQPVRVNLISHSQQRLFRVTSDELGTVAFAALRRRADSAGIQYWRLRSNVHRKSETDPQDMPHTAAVEVVQQPPNASVPPNSENINSANTVQPKPTHSAVVASQHVESLENVESRRVVQATPQLGGARLTPVGKLVSVGDSKLEWELGVQSRIFANNATFGQDRQEASISAQMTYYRGWDNDTHSVTMTPFVRLDSADRERTHADLREFFYSRVGSSWDIHVGAKRVFWGVTEFSHLIDIINQTDLVENLDTEDKLGQPMVQLSLVRDWGMLEVFALTGARTRTYPGDDGRLRLPFEVLDNATFESGAEELRLDGAVRWSHYMGPFELGIHHFSGTSRDPMLRPELAGGGTVVLRQYYPVIDQTGVDAQAFYGDWAFKMEGFTRSGYGERYAAVNVGFERTIVGIFNTGADFGFVGEYMFDERGDDAINTFFENDIALGGRLLLNDFADTKALLGVVVDTNSDEYFLSLEASRRLNATWLLSVEGRIFGGGEDIDVNNLLPVLIDADFKSAWLQRDDYLQVELKKYF